MEFEITIPKGTFVKTYYPNRDRVSKRKQVISYEVSPFDKTIMWAGSAGYWRWVQISDIIDANPALKEYMGEFGW